MLILNLNSFQNFWLITYFIIRAPVYKIEFLKKSNVAFPTSIADVIAHQSILLADSQLAQFPAKQLPVECLWLHDS